MLSVIMLSVIMLSVIMLSVIMLSVIMLSVFMPSVITLSVVKLSVVKLSISMLSAIMLSVIMLSVVAPKRLLGYSNEHSSSCFNVRQICYSSLSHSKTVWTIDLKRITRCKLALIFTSADHRKFLGLFWF
jgi:hypothetical protein